MAKIQFSLQASTAQIAYVESMLEGIKGGVQKALTTAVNETLRKFRTALTNSLDKVHGAGRNTILHRVKIKEGAHGDHYGGRVTVSRAPVPVHDFHARYTKRGGAAVQYMTGDPVLNFKHVFRARMPGGGHVGAFERRVKLPKVAPTKGRYAGKVYKRGPNKGKLILRQQIKEKYGPPVVETFKRKPDVANQALADLAEIFNDTLDRKIKWLLDTAGK
jgi:hypothetical protein